ncbi:MAG: hypothetical protein KZQ83_14155 [gamma proteobacterium symbiont of Taylorina sp.]|nr:hypothetical protein [gamma proteobacterium symbiont of Taylorina sp.]
MTGVIFLPYEKYADVSKFSSYTRATWKCWNSGSCGRRYGEMVDCEASRFLTALLMVLERQKNRLFMSVKRGGFFIA